MSEEPGQCVRDAREKRIRSFVAIALPPSAREALMGARHALQRQMAAQTGAWHPPEQRPPSRAEQGTGRRDDTGAWHPLRDETAARDTGVDAGARRRHEAGAHDAGARHPFRGPRSRRDRRPGRPALRWLRPESWHITLRFLGELEWTRLAALGDALGSALAPLPRFEVRLREVSLFPAGRRPRVLVTRAEVGARLDELARCVERIAVGCGVSPEVRPFRPHLTLARFRGRPASPLVLSAPLALEHEVVFRVDAAVVFRSTLGQGGAVYSELARCPLAPVAAQSPAETAGPGDRPAS